MSYQRAVVLQRSPLRGRRTGWSMILVLSGMLWTSASLFLPATAQAQTKRLDLFMTFQGGIQHGFDGLFVPRSVYNPFDPNSTEAYRFVGGPTAVSDRPGRLWLASKTTQGYLAYNLSSDNGLTSWRGWTPVPGSRQGGVCTSRCYTWIDDSSPAFSSWGPGRLELFIFARRDDGAIALMHTWGDNGFWSGRWESLGTGLMQGSPTAVSWGPGRTDVFVRGGGNELAHKWFENGRWSSGWEDLGGVITSSPSATSMAPGHVDISVRGVEGGLWHLWFINGGWGWWEPLGAAGVLQEGTDPVAAASEWGVMDVFVWRAAWAVLLDMPYRFGWHNFAPPVGGTPGFNGPVAATYWVP
jgi:hypothetical protein